MIPLATTVGIHEMLDLRFCYGWLGWYLNLCFDYISVCYSRYLIANNINNIFKYIFTISTDTKISYSSSATFGFTPHTILRLILFKDNLH